MPNAFNFSASPFDCLTPAERELVRDNVDVAYYREGEVILEVGTAPMHLFIVIKGVVTQLDGEEVVGTYGPEDCFDGRGLVARHVSSRFVASEEVLAYQLAHQTVNELIASNATFGALLFSDLSQKLNALAQRHHPNDVPARTLARVDECLLRPAPVVDASMDILSVTRLFQREHVASVLVRGVKPREPHVSDTPVMGIFRRTLLQTAILDGRALDQLPVGDLASYPLIEIRAEAPLGDAMALMLRHRIHCLVVREGEQVLGILEDLDLFSYLADQAHLINVKMDQANDLHALAQVSAEITRLIASQQRSGIRVHLIATVVQQLNARLFERAWDLIAPAELRAHSCLFVMGSEGRAEQLLKTDQDNALVLEDGYTPPSNLAEICEQFSQALQSFGYPPCPGGVMLSNPLWRKSVQEWQQTAREWLLMPSAESLMHLAIFMDAHAVCGQTALLHEVREHLLQFTVGNDAMLNRFAAAIDAFGEGGGRWWNRLLGLGDSEQHLYLKKEGIFPLVHGVRSLALMHHVSATNTVTRIEELVRQGHLSARMGADLTESLYFFMTLKLKAGLLELERQQPVSGAIDMSTLSSLDRDLLKDTLEIVKRFKVLIRQRFHLSTG